jgi:hypothetical protein
MALNIVPAGCASSANASFVAAWSTNRKRSATLCDALRRILSNFALPELNSGEVFVF